MVDRSRGSSGINQMEEADLGSCCPEVSELSSSSSSWVTCAEV